MACSPIPLCAVNWNTQEAIKPGGRVSVLDPTAVVCVCVYICGVYLACVYSVGAVRQSSGMRLDGPVGVGIVRD